MSTIGSSAQRGRRLFAASVAAVLAAGAVGCGTGEPARNDEASHERPRRAAPSDQARAVPTEVALGRLLRRRAAALESGDAAALTRTSQGAQRRRDARLARNVRALPVTRVAYAIDSASVDGGAARLRVRLSHRVAGVAGRWTSRRRLRAVRRDGRWRVAGETARRPELPWEVARYTSTGSRRFRVLHPASVNPSAAGLGAQLDAAYARVRRALPGARPARRYLVLVAPGPRTAGRLLGGADGIEQLSAVTDATVTTEGRAQRVRSVDALRIVIPWSDFAARPPESRRRILVHELVHAVLAPRTSGRTPAWLQEGIALHVSGDRRDELASARLAAAAAGRRGPSLAGLSRPDAIGRLAGDGLSAAYAYSSAAAFLIAERYGADALPKLLAAFADPDLAGRPGPRLGDAVLQRTLGVGLRELDAEVRATLSGSGRGSG